MRYSSLSLRPSRTAITLFVLLLLAGGAVTRDALAQRGSNSPGRVGQWSAPLAWPDVGIHLHLLPNGNVLTWADDDNVHYYDQGVRGPDFTKAYVWDVGTSASPYYEPISNRSTNLFCSGHSFLPDGRLLIAGGHEGKNGEGSQDANIFDYRVGAYGSWSRTTSMSAGRWYPSACTLASGEVLVLSGSGVGPTQIPEVYQAGGQWRSLTNAARTLPYYPYSFVAPNGKVFFAGPGQDTNYLDTGGAGQWTFVANRNFMDRDYGSAVMYDNGKVLVMGGFDPPTNTAEVIDLNASYPAWRYVAPMAYARRHLNATLLPDGKVLVTGGTSSAGFNTAAGTVRTAELWDPATERWSKVADMQVPRLYHSTAMLLPDGRVLCAGGGRPAADGEPLTTEHRDAEIYSPPYLFNGARPKITSAPTWVGYNQTISVGTPDAASIAQVTWIGLSSVTHTFNMGQRINRLSFSRSGSNLLVTTPANSNLCPPGHYLLFILNGNGVPSEAKIIRIG